MAKTLSGFIIALVIFMMFFTAGVAIFMSEINARYEVPDYDQSELDFYNKLDEVHSTSKSIEENTYNISSKSGFIDTLGGFFESGYGAIKIGLGSFNVFREMADKTFDQSMIQDPSGALRTGILTIAIIALFLGIVISAIVKRNM